MSGWGVAQGNRILDGQDFEEVVTVPAGLLAFGLDADFGGVLLFEEVQDQVSHHRQVLVAMAGSDSPASPLLR